VIKRQFKAELSQLPMMQKWIHECVYSLDVDKHLLNKIELACEEALVNIISYAYKDGDGSIELQVNINNKNRIEITIIDQGKFFNPLLGDITIDPNTPIEEREIGGLGILMIRKVMDEVHYKRADESNVLKLVKKYY